MKLIYLIELIILLAFAYAFMPVCFAAGFTEAALESKPRYADMTNMSNAEINELARKQL